MSALLDVTGVTLRYKTPSLLVTATDRVSFQVDAADRFVLLGPSSGQGGLGWFIFENRNLLDIPAVFSGLLTVITIGLVVENLIFRTIERRRS